MINEVYEDVVNNSLKHGGSNGKYKKVFEMIVCSVCSIVNCWCISLLKYIDFFFFFTLFGTHLLFVLDKGEFVASIV